LTPSAEEVAIELASPTGEPLRVEWPAGPSPGEAPWRLRGRLDWDAVEALRIVSATLPDGRGLALAALRPAGASGHGEEAIGAALIARGAAEPVEEALFSVEHGGDGLPRRVGLELYADPDALPLRIAADVTDASREREDGVVHLRAGLDVRLEGKRSTGLYEVLSVDPGGRQAR
jgi:hypothetical protein